MTPASDEHFCLHATNPMKVQFFVLLAACTLQTAFGSRRTPTYPRRDPLPGGLVDEAKKAHQTFLRAFGATYVAPKNPSMAPIPNEARLTELTRLAGKLLPEDLLDRADPEDTLLKMVRDSIGKAGRGKYENRVWALLVREIKAARGTPLNGLIETHFTQALDDGATTKKGMILGAKRALLEASVPQLARAVVRAAAESFVSTGAAGVDLDTLLNVLDNEGFMARLAALIPTWFNANVARCPTTGFEAQAFDHLTIKFNLIANPPANMEHIEQLIERFNELLPDLDLVDDPNDYLRQLILDNLSGNPVTSNMANRILASMAPEALTRLYVSAGQAIDSLGANVEITADDLMRFVTASLALQQLDDLILTFYTTFMNQHIGAQGLSKRQQAVLRKKLTRNAVIKAVVKATGAAIRSRGIVGAQLQQEASPVDLLRAVISKVGSGLKRRWARLP